MTVPRAPWQPIVRDEPEGAIRFWRACGKSEEQPFCDGSHASLGTGTLPLRVVIPKTGKYPWCTCKQSKAKSLCDETNTKLGAR